MKAKRYALGLSLGLLLATTARPVRAQARANAAPRQGETAGAVQGQAARPAPGPKSHVESRCPRLNRRAYDELDARVQLLLQSEGSARSLPGVVCEGKSTWVEWDGLRFDVVGRAPLVDEVVDIIEGQLHDEQRRAEADTKQQEDAAVAAGQPMLERGAGTAPPPPATTQAADRTAVRSDDARGGGIALGIEAERPSDTIGLALGPAFDVGASVGPFMLGAREAVRFSLSGARRVSFMDFQGAIAYGAPLDPSQRLGAVLRFGAEWLIAYPEGNSSQAVVVPITDLGLRVAQPFGRFSLWLGLDAHFRLGSLAMRRISANQVGASLTLGWAFVDWSRK